MKRHQICKKWMDMKRTSLMLPSRQIDFVQPLFTAKVRVLIIYAFGCNVVAVLKVVLGMGKSCKLHCLSYAFVRG